MGNPLNSKFINWRPTRWSACCAISNRSETQSANRMWNLMWSSKIVSGSVGSFLKCRLKIQSILMDVSYHRGFNRHGWLHWNNFLAWQLCLLWMYHHGWLGCIMNFWVLTQMIDNFQGWANMSLKSEIMDNHGQAFVRQRLHFITFWLKTIFRVKQSFTKLIVSLISLLLKAEAYDITLWWIHFPLPRSFFLSF